VSIQAIARMVLLPAAFALAVGLQLRSHGAGAVFAAAAVFLAVQLVVLAGSHRRLARAERRLAETRASRQHLRSQR
jgi:hypothetical protein